MNLTDFADFYNGAESKIVVKYYNIDVCEVGISWTFVKNEVSGVACFVFEKSKLDGEKSNKKHWASTS